MTNPVIAKKYHFSLGRHGATLKASDSANLLLAGEFGGSGPGKSRNSVQISTNLEIAIFSLELTQKNLDHLLSLRSGRIGAAPQYRCEELRRRTTVPSGWFDGGAPSHWLTLLQANSLETAKLVGNFSGLGAFHAFEVQYSSEYGRFRINSLRNEQEIFSKQQKLIRECFSGIGEFLQHGLSATGPEDGRRVIRDHTCSISCGR